MSVTLSPLGGVAAQFFDSNGVILSGGKIYTYAAGTTTEQATFTSSTGNTPLPNPIELNPAGRVPTGEIWLTATLQYKFVIKNADESITIGTYDNITGINSSVANFATQQEFQTATAGQTVFNLTTMQYQPGVNSLSVFVDGVNQYGPGAQYSYVETDSDTVTFNTGLHVGANVKFTTSNINSTAGGSAFAVSYPPPFLSSVTTTVGDKLAQTVSVKDFGAVGNGVFDCTAAIQAALVAADDILFPEGTYLITANITVGAGKTLQFQSGASISAASTYTLDFNNNAFLIAGRTRIFDGSASATNIKTAYPEWWGATHSTTTTQNAAFQAALNALKLNGQLLLNDGFYTLDGTTALTIAKGQAVIGAGMYQTTIRVNTAAANIFKIEEEIGAAIKNLRLQVIGTPTSGIAIYVFQDTGKTVGRFQLENLWIDNAYSGIYLLGNSTTTLNIATLTNVYLRGVFSYGARYEWCENILSTRLFINADTGSGSGAPNNGLILFNKCQSVDFIETSVINCSGSGLFVSNTAGSISRGNDVRWIKFIGCYFDDCAEGVDLNNCSDIRFTNCWMSSNGRAIRGYAGNGVFIRANTEAIVFIGGVASNNGQRGFRVENGANGIMITDMQIAGNSVNDPTTNPFWAIDIYGGTSNFSVTDCIVRGTSFGWSDGNSKGIQVRSGASNNYIITNNQISNVFGSNFLSDGGSGTNKIVTGNLTW